MKTIELTPAEKNYLSEIVGQRQEAYRNAIRVESDRYYPDDILVSIYRNDLKIWNSIYKKLNQ